MALHATWNPNCTNDTAAAFSNGNRDFAAQGSGRQTLSTVGSSDVSKFYYEQAVMSGTPTPSYDEIGVAYVSACSPFTMATRWHYRNNGYIYQNNSYYYLNLPTWTTGDTIGVAVEHSGTSFKIWFRDKNGLWIHGDPAAGTNPSFDITNSNEIFAYARGQYLVNHRINAGQDDYVHTPPSGFNDLAIPDIVQYEDLALDLSYIHDHAEDMRASLKIAGTALEDLPAELRLVYLALEGDMPLGVNLSGQWLRSLALDLRLETGLTLDDMAARLRLTDGTALASMPVRAVLTRKAPLYQAVIAQRLRSVKHA